MIANVQPEVVLHLASRSEVALSFRNYTEVTNVNYVAVVNLAEACRQHSPDLKAFVMASTMETYGNAYPFTGTRAFTERRCSSRWRRMRWRSSPARSTSPTWATPTTSRTSSCARRTPTGGATTPSSSSSGSSARCSPVTPATSVSSGRSGTSSGSTTSSTSTAWCWTSCHLVRRSSPAPTTRSRSAHSPRRSAEAQLGRPGQLGHRPRTRRRGALPQLGPGQGETLLGWEPTVEPERRPRPHDRDVAGDPGSRRRAVMGEHP
jgi:hypothetical protein